MQITLTIPDEFAAQVLIQGISMEAYVERLIEEAARKGLLPDQPRTRQQIEAFFEAMAQGSRGLPLLPTKSFTRENNSMQTGCKRSTF